MEHRIWLLRKIRSRHARETSERQDRKEWSRVRRASRWGNTLGFRRFVVLLWIGTLAVDPWIVFQLAQRFAVLQKLPDLLLPTLSQLLITCLAFRAMQIGLAQPTIEDSAVMQYGAEFDALTHQQREELFQQRSKEFILGSVRKDEREAELRLRAEGAAYRLLRPGLVIAVGAYWAVCLLGPFVSIRDALTITAIAFTWLAVAVLVLPTMVRMWTQPNEAGEPQIVGDEKEA